MVDLGSIVAPPASMPKLGIHVHCQGRDHLPSGSEVTREITSGGTRSICHEVFWIGRGKVEANWDKKVGLDWIGEPVRVSP